MFRLKIKKIKLLKYTELLYCFLLAFCSLLPFQFALNPALGFDVAIVRVIIPIFFLAWFFFMFKNKLPLLISDKKTYLLITFIFLALFSILFSDNMSWSLRKLFFLATIFPLYFVCASILDTFEKKRTVIFSLVVGASILSLLAIIQFTLQFVFGIDRMYSFMAGSVSHFFLGNSFANTVLAYPSWLVNADGKTYMRAIAIFPDPHMLSYYLGLLIPWTIALWALAKKHKAWLFIAMLSLITADLLTFTRGGYIALIAGALVVLPLVSRRSALKIIIGALSIFVFFTNTPHNPVAQRLTSSFDVQEGSNQGRLSNWQQAFAIIKANPFGVGIGAYPLAVKQTATYREPIYAHNLYLDITAELGIQTVLVFIAILLLTFKAFWQLSKTQPFFIAGVASITVFSIHSLVENPMYSVHVFPLFLIILALCFKSHPYEKNTDAK